MTTFLLVRHGETDAVGKTIVGRMPGVHLNATGRAHARRLAQRLSRLPIRAIYSSPLERALETAEPVAASLDLAPHLTEDLSEVRCGGWEGAAIADLDQREDWRRFNAFCSCVRAPDGELMIEIQTRMVQQFESLCRRHSGETVAIFSHADPLRAALAHYLGIPLDLCLRIEISPASVSVLQIGDWAPRILCLNETGEIPL